ncbi:hypothetical protein CDLVIII_3615 [Clostridium sp. DL-VIII]|uniref:DNRLRE domain-containing protein n=1 Tax=Clostridium sp. DL-VIII TaxID=641107 RepID=UPI00023AFC6E|nr:DNRLRE domain-containing protein [Clostridium sp. DL-VIII]EHJ00173.1 hypothetical protein CDLVIII_3615 [Clostridium sp. DL-VIII]
MKSIILPAIKSLTITNKHPDKSINEDTISVGSDGEYEYYSYLFFDISSIPSNVIISTAKLTLFKVDNFFNDISKKISISPLYDYFSAYTTYNNPPDYDRYTIINFYPLTTNVSVTINIRTIVSSWIKNSLRNKGIILYGRKQAILASFGSVKSSDNYLVPFIVINYIPYSPNKCYEKKLNDEYIHPPDDYSKKNHNDNCFQDDCRDKYIKMCKEELEDVLFKVCKKACNCSSNPYPSNASIARAVDVTGVVAPLSIYYIVVDLQVTRASSGQINHYYVSDEYDNSLNNNSLSIDKTYNIAINPPIQSGDIDNVVLYGSYKGSIS